MLPLTKCSATLLVCCLLSSCQNLTVKEPVCSPPPIPQSLLQPCPPLDPLADGQMGTLYLQMLKDTGTLGECQRRQQALVEVVKYQRQVCDQFLSQPPQSKEWWQW